MKKIGIFLALTFIFSNAGYSGRGQFGAEFLLIPSGLRSEALGGAYVGLGKGSEAVFINPAGLTQQKGNNIALEHLDWLEESACEYLSYTRSLGRWGGIGVGIFYFHLHDVYREPQRGEIAGGFQNTALSVNFSYGGYVSQALHSGITLKYLTNTLAKWRAQSVAVDLGLLYHLSRFLSLGGSIQNFGFPLKFIEVANSLPLRLKLGGALKFWQERLIILSDTTLSNEEIKFHTGIELKFPLREGTLTDVLVKSFTRGLISARLAEKVIIRAGYETELRGEESEQRFSLGGAAEIKTLFGKIEVGFTTSFLEIFGLCLRFGVIFKF
jgi:hypothetical protein